MDKDYDKENREKIAEVFTRHQVSKTDVGKFMGILRDIAKLYDRCYGMYPENTYEGYALYTFGRIGSHSDYSVPENTPEAWGVEVDPEYWLDK